MVYYNYHDKINKEMVGERERNPVHEKLVEYLLGDNYETFIVEYIGNLAEKLSTIYYADVFITEKFYAILFVKRGMINQLLEAVPEIINFEPNYIFTLSQLSLDFNPNSEFIDRGDISLDGEGVIIGIIGNGIDYLSPRFITEQGESRIVAFWDQTIQRGPGPEFFPFGTTYNNAEINDIVASKENNTLQKDNIPSRDKVAFGNAIAGIIGGRKLDKDDTFVSIAPKCEFAIVNLQPPTENFLQYYGIENNSGTIYQTSVISTAIQYLSNVQQSLKKPMVVYLPLGSNSGGRSGETILERYIDVMTQKREFSIVTNTGNQGHGETHAGGTINATGEIRDIFINVGNNQSSLYMSIYTRNIDNIYTSITSSKGKKLNQIPIEEKNKILSYEENGIHIVYCEQQKNSGYVNLELIIRNMNPGLWKISLFGQNIVSGVYDIWLFSKELLKPGTRLIKPNPETTLLTPGTAVNILVASCFDNVNNKIATDSGRGYPRSGTIQPGLTIEGFNLLTAGINNALVNSSGPAMAGAILVGAIALIYQWGLLQGKYTELYSAFLKNLLVSSTLKDESVIYPNAEVGFGKLSFKKLVEALKHERKDTYSGIDNCIKNNNSAENLYINIPAEIYYRFK
ncbi:S8 family peptidase [Clostridium sp.]|uniref:S8 family peptidase n=1 Tax=Clostridium sp. TaxID=1506 RepID=UPI002FC61006